MFCAWPSVSLSVAVAVAVEVSVSVSDSVSKCIFRAIASVCNFTINSLAGNREGGTRGQGLGARYVQSGVCVICNRCQLLSCLSDCKNVSISNRLISFAEVFFAFWHFGITSFFLVAFIIFVVFLTEWQWAFFIWFWFFVGILITAS